MRPEQAPLYATKGGTTYIKLVQEHSFKLWAI